MQPSYPEIEPRILEQWQEITNLLSRLCHVPAALIMRQNESTMEVMSSAQHPDNPYVAHSAEPLNGELYCEAVIRNQSLLEVPNARQDPHWDHNPDLELGMLYYCGVPINWPDARPFGTLCILDRVGKQASDDERQLLHKFAAMVEMTLELMVANQQLETMSLHDGLTGIANRRLFDVVLEREWSRSQRHGQPLSLLLCDIDFFKNYNDSLGHVQGDECLKQVAMTLASISQRKLDLCARYGGEEFVILLPETSAELALQLAERCRERVQALKIPHPDTTIADVVSISVGVATMTVDRATGRLSCELLRLADKALYLAKQRGRNRVVGVDASESRARPLHDESGLESPGLA